MLNKNKRNITNRSFRNYTGWFIVKKLYSNLSSVAKSDDELFYKTY